MAFLGMSKEQVLMEPYLDNDIFVISVYDFARILFNLNLILWIQHIENNQYN